MKIVFVKRPTLWEGRGIQAALLRTAKNGKALRCTHGLGGQYSRLARRAGLVLHQTQRGKFFLAWCENGTRATKKGAR